MKNNNYMNCSYGFMIDLENILNKIIEDGKVQAQIGNIIIAPIGIKEDTISGRRQIFEIVRYVKE